MIGRAFKLIKNIIKWTFRLVVLAAIIIVLWYGFNYLTSAVYAQAGKQCQTIAGETPGGKVVVYKALAAWLETQKTYFVTVDNAYYEKSDKGDQVVVEYSTLNNWYHGKKVLDQETLEKYCSK